MADNKNNIQIYYTLNIPIEVFAVPILQNGNSNTVLQLITKHGFHSLIPSRPQPQLLIYSNYSQKKYKTKPSWERAFIGFTNFQVSLGTKLA